MKFCVKGCYNCPAYSHDTEWMTNWCGLASKDDQPEIMKRDTLGPFTEKQAIPNDCPLKIIGAHTIVNA